MKLAVTGSGGFLGSRLVYYYKERYQVEGIGHKELSITDEEAVLQYLCRMKPDIVIHCAAVSDTAYAENHPEESYAINVMGSEYIARACEQCGAKLIFMSSDQIYNGNTIRGIDYDALHDACREGVDDNPVNEYAKQKQEAEQRIVQRLSNALCLRLSWMYDRPRAGMKTNVNLIGNLMRAERENRNITFALHEYRGITYAGDVAENMEKVFDSPGGIYNFGCPNNLNTYQTVVRAARGLQVLSSRIQADEERFKGYPRNLTMSMEKLIKQDVVFDNTVTAMLRFLSVEEKNMSAPD